MRPAFTVIDADQRSAEWFAARCGRLTGSVAADMLAKLRGKGEAADRRNLRVRLALERVLGQPMEDSYVSKEMQRGTDLEPEALAAYEAATGAFVRAVGFVRRDDVLAGYSPDGVVEDFAGLVEVKAPNMATHLEYLRLRDQVPARYVPQCLHGLWVTGAPWIDFVSYDPRFPEALRLYVVRFTATPAQLAEYEADALAFLAEVAREADEIRALEVAA